MTESATDVRGRSPDASPLFIVYIFVHATPEVVPFLIYALSDGAVPLPARAPWTCRSSPAS